MSATIYLHPKSVELNLYAVCSTLKTRGYEVPRQPGQRFLIAQPDSPPPVGPQQVVRLYAPRLHRFWPCS